ncbi:unnamed protein product, partial [Didymodactylos carnosus]
QSVTKSLVRPLIQQGLANGDPDMDAIYRLTRSYRHKRINIEFGKLPPVAIPAGLLVPFNSQNTLFHYDSFWALWLPTTTNFRVCDIWRGYFAQRLLWEIESSLTFHPASVFQDRNPHNYLFDFIDELPLYEDAERLIDFLRQWKCSTGGSYKFGSRQCTQFFDRIYWLAIDMVEQKFWKMKDVWLCTRYLTDLISLGYQTDHLNLNQKEWTLYQIKEENSTQFFPQQSSPLLTQSLKDNTCTSRVAVCVSGQPRTLNMTLPVSLSVIRYAPTLYNSGPIKTHIDSNLTNADNIQAFLFENLPAFDVFMYVSTTENHPRLPRVGDTSVCELLRPKLVSNKLLCEIPIAETGIPTATGWNETMQQNA